MAEFGLILNLTYLSLAQKLKGFMSIFMRKVGSVKYNSEGPTGWTFEANSLLERTNVEFGAQMETQDHLTLSTGSHMGEQLHQIGSGYKKYRFLTTLTLLVCDTLAILIGTAILAGISVIRHDTFGSSLLEFEAINVILGLLVISFFGLYNPSATSGGSETYLKVFNANACFVLLTACVWTWGSTALVSFRMISAWWLVYFLCLAAGRFIARRICYFLRKAPALRKRTIIVGAGPEGQAMAHQWSEIGGAGVNVVGFVDRQAPESYRAGVDAPYLGMVQDLGRLIQETSADCVFLARPSLVKDVLENDETFVEALWNVELQVGTGVSELLASRMTVVEEGFVPIADLSRFRMTGIHYIAKTFIDYLISATLLLILAPILILLGVMVAIESPGPAFFRRRVCGVNRKEFTMFKLRTMKMNGDSLLSPEEKQELLDTGKLKHDPRITRVGTFMRKYSIDEIPQLLNVLRGEMSLVGPRTITIPEMGKFGRWQHLRTMAKPGMTGLWQVSGRSELTYEDRARLDVYYVRNFTIWLDLKILCMTVPAVLFSKGAY